MSKITLFVMTEKGYAVLTALAERYSELLGLVVAGRDSHIKKDCFEEIQACCAARGIPFRDRTEITAIETPYAMAISWRWLIQANQTELIVFHDSLLPRYRGFNPLVTALINGDPAVGVTALFATEEYDRGDIIGQLALPVSYPIKIQTAIEQITETYRTLACQVVDRIAQGQPLTATPQPLEGVSYSLWRDDTDYLIDWAQSAHFIKRFIDAVGFPYLGAASHLEGRLVRILEAEEVEDVVIENRTPGKVIFMRQGKPVVVCGQGLLLIRELVDNQTNASLLPLPRFRVRLG
ncbi:MAG: methionyl-tRNA formyltransferase [Blastocatellia bacterium]|nr:methionyl-tRNA formyltransferase [Blastocatellia bacterium]